MENDFDLIIVGSGPAGLGAAFEVLLRAPKTSVLVVDRNEFSSGGLRNDCKMNFTWPIGFPEICWTKDQAETYLDRVEAFLSPRILEKKNVDVYRKRAEKLGVSLLSIRQTHLGTDGGLELIKGLTLKLKALGAELSLGEMMLDIDMERKTAITDRRELRYRDLILAPGRGGFAFLQNIMNKAGIAYRDNVVDIGLRIETKEERYSIVRDC